MAIRQRNNRFQVYWNNPFSGKRESVTVDTKPEAIKQDALIKYELQFEREKFRPVETVTREVRQTEQTLEDAFFLFLKEKRYTKQRLNWVLYAGRDALNMFGSLPISGITYQQLCQFKSDIMAHDEWKSSTKYSKLYVLKSVLKWAFDRELLESPVRFPDLPRLEYEKFIPPTPEEIDRIMTVAPLHIQRVIVIGCQTGMRIGPCELFRLRWSDVDIFRKCIRVPAAKKNKSEPWRDIPIRESLVRIIGLWKMMDEQKGMEYVINYRGKPVSTIRYGWLAALQRAGIDRKIRPYDLRHAFATWAIAAGSDPGTVAKLMGHTDTNMIYKHYQYVLTEQKRKAVESLPDVVHVPERMCL